MVKNKLSSGSGPVALVMFIHYTFQFPQLVMGTQQQKLQNIVKFLHNSSGSKWRWEG